MAETPTSYGKAIELLARRPHFRRELATKLSRRGYGREDLDATLDRLQSAGWLDDASLARDFARSKLARQGLGRRRLFADLLRRGVDAEIADQALDDVCPENDTELAEQSARGWWARRPSGESAALARYLERRGFSRRAIFAALRSTGPESAEQLSEDL